MGNVKIPNSENNVSPFILNRWSARSFADKSISNSQLNTIFEAASWAPSSMNEQPWIYKYAKKGEKEFSKLHECLLQGNQSWAINANVLILSLARKNFKRNGEFNRHYLHDVGAANTLMLLQAAEMGILSHMMAGIDFQKTVSMFNLDENIDISCIIALGFPDTPDKLPEPFKTREATPRTRLNLSEFVFHLS